jgi:hypothetical protein
MEQLESQLGAEEVSDETAGHEPNATRWMPPTAHSPPTWQAAGRTLTPRLPWRGLAGARARGGSAAGAA